MASCVARRNGDDRPQLAPAEAGLAPAQPPRAVASLSQCSGIDVDDLAELSLDELVDKAFTPGSPHTRAPLTPHASTPRSPHTHPRPNPVALARAQTRALSVPLTRPSPSSRPCCNRGRSSTCGVCLAHPTLHREHALTWKYSLNSRGGVLENFDL